MKLRMSPLFVKYQTRGGAHFIFGVASGEILRVGEVVYSIIDDYRVLTTEEIVTKHCDRFGAQAIDRALTTLDDLESRNVLLSHPPEPTVPVKAVQCDHEAEPILEFLQRRRRLLTLEVTHDCNLSCEYCSFGSHYLQTRAVNALPMSLATARNAVECFLDHEPIGAGIGFYGGEPLLEFQLIREVVCIAEQMAFDKGVDLRFSLTTNGTLLKDEVIHYLVEHQFSILISLDGDKESHDRYRLFRNCNGIGRSKGSFDVIVANMARFVELYPIYHGRGLAVTITATSNFSAIEKFLQRWKPSYPTVMASVVSPVAPQPSTAGEQRPLRFGCCHLPECGNRAFGLHCSGSVESDSRGRENVSPSQSTSSKDVPDFDNWLGEAQDRLRAHRDEFIEVLCGATSKEQAVDLAYSYPVAKSIFDGTTRDIHKRRIGGSRARRPTARMSCFPGATRTYCSSNGVLYSCEKTAFGELFVLGNAASDVDANRSYTLVEKMRINCDCGNCVIKGLCGMCPAQLKESEEHPGTLDIAHLLETCQKRMADRSVAARLASYTEIMDNNADVLDWIYEGESSSADDWLNKVKLFTASPLRIAWEIEELQEWV